MQSINTRHQFYLYRHKIVLFLLLVVVMLPAHAQNETSENLIDYDAQWIHYGFAIGLHNAKYKIRYSDAFATPSLDSLHSIVPGNLPGWKVGFVVDMLINPVLSFRILPTVGFYEYDLTYRFTDGTSIKDLKPPTMVELPLLIKYKSARRGNIAIYTVGGINTAFEAAGQGDELDTRERLTLRNWNFSVDAGIGFDLYFPLFKFSPEVRYAWGLRDMLTNDPNAYDVALKRLSYQNIAFFITFEGGPTYLRNAMKKKR